MRFKKTAALACLIAISVFFPTNLLAAPSPSTTVVGQETRKYITASVVTGYRKDGFPITKPVKGKFLGLFPPLEDKNPMMSDRGMVPVQLQTMSWTGKKWKPGTAYGWAWTQEVPTPVQREVRYQHFPSNTCCTGRSQDRTNQLQVTVINNIDIQLLIQQSRQVAQRDYWPDNCNCGRPYRGYYYHPRHGYWGRSHCGRAMGFSR